MQETHKDWHIMMVASLVLVAFSAIVQTASGLQADTFSALKSEQMFASVVAAGGQSTSPKVQEYTKQMRSIQINENARATIRGSVKSVEEKALILETWGGEWRIVVSDGTKISNARGKVLLTDIKVGDFVGVEGLANSSGVATLAAQSLRNYTTIRAVAATAAAELMRRQQDSQIQTSLDVLATGSVQMVKQGEAPKGFPIKEQPKMIGRPEAPAAAPAQSIGILPPGVGDARLGGGLEKKAIQVKSAE